jgi:hypothetical protein
VLLYIGFLGPRRWALVLRDLQCRNRTRLWGRRAVLLAGLLRPAFAYESCKLSLGLGDRIVEARNFTSPDDKAPALIRTQTQTPRDPLALSKGYLRPSCVRPLGGPTSRQKTYPGRFLIRLCDLVGAPRGRPGPATKWGGRGRPAGHAAVPLAVRR